MKGFEIKVERECSTCKFRNHSGNGCAFTSFNCRGHKDLPKWKLHRNHKLSIIEKVMKA